MFIVFNTTAVLHQDDPNNNLIEMTFSNLDGEEGSTGIVVVKLIPEWAPLGVERFKELTAASFWEGCRAFRVVPNFVVQLGINGDPSVQKTWRSQSFKDDPVKTTNARGTITFATSGKDTRTTQIFFNIGKSNAYLDKQGFSPFGEVIKGMDVIDRIYSEYREKPNQGTSDVVWLLVSLSYAWNHSFIEEMQLKQLLCPDHLRFDSK